MISLVLRPTPVLELQVAFKIPYVYDYVTKLCRTQACGIRQEGAMHRKYKRLKLDCGEASYHVTAVSE
jgi:hypothetical protein